MMPGARFFFLSHVEPFILADESTGTADYNQLRRAAVLSILPAALFIFTSSREAPTHPIGISSCG